jgi:hypothetical protein
MRFRYRLHLAILVFIAVAAITLHSFSPKPVFASTDDDVKKLTDIEMNQTKLTGANPASIALALNTTADTVTIVGPTGVAKYFAKDALLATAQGELPDVKLSVAISDLQVHLYGDTAIVTYQRQIKQFASTESLPAGFNLTGRSFTCMDTFVKRNGEWKAIANAVVSQSPIPDEVYKAVKTEAAELPN